MLLSVVCFRIYSKEGNTGFPLASMIYYPVQDNLL